jgi:tRNA uridine 5-carbamoylmethylation protein Kti12
MSKVWCIVGLPGCGKTHYASKLAKSSNNAHIIDDIKSISDLPENGKYTDIIITDPYFCMDTVRELALTHLTNKYTSIEWVFFENDPEKCITNVLHRNDGRKVREIIRVLSKKYNPPVDKIKPIWQPAVVVAIPEEQK